jgi:hypothetical protein
MENVSQLTLPLFAPATFDELLARHKSRDTLSVVVNGRLRRGWQVRTQPLSQTRVLIIPPYLSDAPEEIKGCLVEWALLPYRARRPYAVALREKRSSLEKKIWQYVESLPHAPRRSSRFDPAKFSGFTSGTVYDLREVFDSVNASRFGGNLRALVRWGDASSKTSYHMAKTDAAGTRFHLITIAGIYNHPQVPRFAIEAIMHHEMLHIAIPPYRKNGRMVIHGREFRETEERFTHFREWRTWERERLPFIMKRRWLKRLMKI